MVQDAYMVIGALIINFNITYYGTEKKIENILKTRLIVLNIK